MSSLSPEASLVFFKVCLSQESATSFLSPEAYEVARIPLVHPSGWTYELGLIQWRNSFLGSSVWREGFPSGSDGKECACSMGDPGLIPWSERSPGERNGCPIQYSWGFPKENGDSFLIGIVHIGTSSGRRKSMGFELCRMFKKLELWRLI